MLLINHIVNTTGFRRCTHPSVLL